MSSVTADMTLTHCKPILCFIVTAIMVVAESLISCENIYKAFNFS